MGSRAHFGPWHRRLAVAALVALLLRAWVPAGFMPAGDGSLALILCPGTVPVLASAASAHHGPDGRHRHDGRSEKAGGTACPFAFASVAAGPPAPATLAPPPDPFAALIVLPSVPSASPDFPNLLPPSTGPPARL